MWIGARLAERRAVHAGVGLLSVTLARLALSDSRLYGPTQRWSILDSSLFAVAATAFWASAWWIRHGRARNGSLRDGTRGDALGPGARRRQLVRPDLLP